MFLNVKKNYFVREFIQPVKEKKDIDQVLSEPVQQTKTEDISRLLESLSIFTLSSSQIPTKQKSIVLQDLIKLTLPNVKKKKSRNPDYKHV